MMMGLCYNSGSMFIFELKQTVPSGGVKPVMMKRILCLLAVLTFGFVFSAAAEEAAEPVTAAELGTLLDRVLAEALTEAPLNDPAEESAQDEDGTCFWYENAKIYADSTELTADTPVNALVFESLEGPIFRGTGMDTRTEDLLAGRKQSFICGKARTADSFTAGSCGTDSGSPLWNTVRYSRSGISSAARL